jgi:hypothetical protein
MKSSAVATGDTADKSQYNNLRDDAYGASQLLVHAQSTPGMTLKVEAGVVYVNGTRVVYAGGNTPSFTAPVGNPRIDVVTIDNAGTIAITQGTAAASPSAPTDPVGKIVLAHVYLRTGTTAIHDTDQGSHGYVQRDIRPIIGQQLPTQALVQSLIPATDNSIDLGDASHRFATVHAMDFKKNGVSVGGKFGGTGADGALSISSGTTTLSFASANYLVKNYTSISITSTGKLAFSNPATDGSIAVLKSQGNVTLSSTQPGVDVSAMGAAGGSSSNLGTPNRGTQAVNHFADTRGNVTSYGGSDVAAGTAHSSIHNAAVQFVTKSVFIAPGSGGGGSTGSSGNAANHGAGGRGGGGLYIECAGDLNFTGSVTVSGGNGANGSVNGAPGGGGGGAGWGFGRLCLCLFFLGRFFFFYWGLFLDFPLFYVA